MEIDTISVRGAREHNLKGLDVSIPRNQLVVITGPSGSGKSSLAFDTIFAEGQRRYVSSLSAYARQFLAQNHKPAVDQIDGLSPAIAIEQRSGVRSPRSTVGTLTEIHDHLRLLFGRAGRAHCHICGNAVGSLTVQEIVDQILAGQFGERLLIDAPLVTQKEGSHQALIERLRGDGFARLLVDGDVVSLSEDIVLEASEPHDIEVVIDRIKLRNGLKQRVSEAVELALSQGRGQLVVRAADGTSPTTLSTLLECDKCGTPSIKLSPRLFSFNAPDGACPDCGGLGVSMVVDGDALIDPELSYQDGAIKLWGSRGNTQFGQAIAAEFGAAKQAVDKPWKKLGKRFREGLIRGAPKMTFEGLVPYVTRRLKETQSDRIREDLQPFLISRTCESCGGARLRPEARAARFLGHTMPEMNAMSLLSLRKSLDARTLSGEAQQVAAEVLVEVKKRLNFLIAVGLEYVSLDRSARTLSGGEAQRIRLATQIGSALQGVIYVLDEPSIGLHQRDNDRLLETLKALRDLGNTVLVVEHDEDTIRAADYIIDLGPGAGEEGGYLVASGTLKQVCATEGSVSGAYLSGKKSIATPPTRRSFDEHVRVVGATGNNLKELDVAFPIGVMTAVTGVSGSGKSTLVLETLLPSLRRHLHRARVDPAPHRDVSIPKSVERVVAIDQSPLGRSPRSNPATYTGTFDPIRQLFAQLPEARTRGYGPGRFSFNVAGGRCDACGGDGVKRIEMHFLPDVFVPCSVCEGARYNRETLEIEFKGYSIADVLALDVREARVLFEAIPNIREKLDTLAMVGLGYLKLGQSATTLSGGEAQRIKLSRELAKRAPVHTVYIMDEPTTGLHVSDVDRLLSVFHHLVDQGHTLIVIEHNLDIIRNADWIVDLGPDGGDRGGAVVSEGTPEQVAQAKASATGEYLKRVL